MAGRLERQARTMHGMVHWQGKYTEEGRRLVLTGSRGIERGEKVGYGGRWREGSRELYLAHHVCQ